MVNTPLKRSGMVPRMIEEKEEKLIRQQMEAKKQQ